MNIYFVRHGKTESNEKGVYYGALDSSINSIGKGQGERLHEYLKNVNFTKAYVSPLKRAKETLALIAPNCKVVEDARLKERSFGVFEGLTYEEIKKKFPDDHDLWIKNWESFQPEHGESFRGFYDRVKEFILDIEKENEDDILVVTHGGVIRAMYCYILGENLDFYWKFASKNGDVSVIKYEDNYMYIDSIIHID